MLPEWMRLEFQGSSSSVVLEVVFLSRYRIPKEFVGPLKFDSSFDYTQLATGFEIET